MNSKIKLMIIAGEVSGDMHAAGIVSAIKEKIPDASFFGIGGKDMRAAGVKTFYDVDQMAVMGLTEVLRKYGFFRRVFNHMLAIALQEKPDAVILVDYPGFNLRFAAKAHAHGLKIIYYICPQVWAWNSSRIPRMAQFVDRLISIFPFEKDCFSETNLQVDFAGHPLVDEASKTWKEPEPALPWQGPLRIALLPGSRQHEIERLLPAMWATAAIIEKKHPDASFIIPVPSPSEEQMVNRCLGKLTGGPSKCSVVSGKTRHILKTAKTAMITSGTATIESSLMLCPMIICYKTALLTYIMAKALVKVKNIGMVNIIAGKIICPEFIQYAVKPEALAAAMEQLLHDSPQRELMIKQMEEVNSALGKPGAAKRAAESVVQAISNRE